MSNKIQLDIDLFCSGCSTALSVEESAGHHILVEPCQICIRKKVQQTADERATEERLDEQSEGVSGKEKLRQWEEEKERRKKELRNVNIEATNISEGGEEK